jgi:hypothetical protein
MEVSLALYNCYFFSLLGELCPGGSMMSGRQDGLAEQCPQSVQVGVYYASCALVEV